MNSPKFEFLSIITNSLDFIILSFLSTLALALSTKKLRADRRYFAAAMLTGYLFGIVSSQTPVLSEYSFLSILVGVVAGPNTLAALQGKTIFQVIQDAIKAKDKELD